MKLRKLLICCIAAVMLLCGCQSNNSTSSDTTDETTTYEYKSEDVTVKSKRDTDIPATVVIPETEDKYPVVVMLHGFMGERGGCDNFEPIANNLAEHGIASIRIDFPGNNESQEPHTEYTLTNMSDDVTSAIEFMQTSYNGDANKIGLVGHSMGGRVAALYLNDSITAAALLSPAANTGFLGLADFMGGMEEVEKMYAEAKEKGHAPFTGWGEPYADMSLTFFEENETADPLKSVSEYNGKLMITVASDDVAVSKETTNAVINAAQHIEVLNVPNSDHIYGAADGSDSQEARQLLVETVSNFLIESLK